MAILLVVGSSTASAQGVGGGQYCEGQYVGPGGDCDSTVVIILPPLPKPDETNQLPGEAPDGTVFAELPDSTVVSFNKNDIISQGGREVILPAEAVVYVPAAEAPDAPSGARIQGNVDDTLQQASERQQSEATSEATTQEDQFQLDELPDTGGPALPLIALITLGACAALITCSLFRSR